MHVKLHERNIKKAHHSLEEQPMKYNVSHLGLKKLLMTLLQNTLAVIWIENSGKMQLIKGGNRVLILSYEVNSIRSSSSHTWCSRLNKRKRKTEKGTGWWKKVKIWYVEEIPERKTSRGSFNSSSNADAVTWRLYTNIEERITIFFSNFNKGHENIKQFASKLSIV